MGLSILEESKSFEAVGVRGLNNNNPPIFLPPHPPSNSPAAVIRR